MEFLFQALCLSISNLSPTQNTRLFTDGNKASLCGGREGARRRKNEGGRERAGVGREWGGGGGRRSREREGEGEGEKEGGACRTSPTLVPPAPPEAQGVAWFNEWPLQ